MSVCGRALKMDAPVKKAQLDGIFPV